MQYVPCPKCGNPVAGKLQGQLTVRCKEKFPFDPSQVRTSVTYNANLQRWKVE
jgi:hypothetical protein